MAYTANINLSLIVEDGNGGQQIANISAAAVVPTRPLFCGSGTATTTPAAISYGPVTTPKALVIVNDGAVELVVDTGGDNHTIGISGSTSKSHMLLLTAPPSTPNVNTASSTAAYRTFILE